jgi:hypothetical protein
VLSDNETPLKVVFPKVGVLFVPATHNVRSTKRLIGNWQMGVESGSYVVAGDEDASRAVPGRHHTEPTGF